MKKRFSVVVFTTILLAASAAYARICFLPDTDCQDGSYGMDNYEQDLTSCKDAPDFGKWVTSVQAGRCKNKEISTFELRCSDNENYFEQTSCRTDKGWCSQSDIGDDLNKYTYTSDRDCPNCYKGLECKSTYKDCKDKPKTVGAGDKCYEIDNKCNKELNNVKYSQCNCLFSTSQYKKESCSGSGLIFTNQCEGDNGTFGTCGCAPGYSTSDNCDYGVEDTVTANNMIGQTLTCYKCRAKPNCPSDKPIWTKTLGKSKDCKTGVKESIPLGNGYCVRCKTCAEEKGRQTSDFDAFWKGYYATPSSAYPSQTCAAGSGKITTDCDILGYDTGTAATGKKCKDGTEPYRCPFDHTQVFCASGL